MFQWFCREWKWNWYLMKVKSGISHRWPLSRPAHMRCVARLGCNINFFIINHHHHRRHHHGASPKSHKHKIPYMGFCASIWDNVRHHCHHHHHRHHHHIQKSKSINTEACLIAHWLKLRYGLMMQAILGHAGDFITVWKKEKSTRPHGNPLCFPKNIFCPMWCNWKRMAVLESA